MELLLKSDLQEEYYWTALENDNPKVIGEPDSTLLNRHEGYEVLPFINRFAKKHGITIKDYGLEIEQLIRNELPGDLRSHKHVTEWLEQELG